MALNNRAHFAYAQAPHPVLETLLQSRTLRCAPASNLDLGSNPKAAKAHKIVDKHLASAYFICNADRLEMAESNDFPRGGSSENNLAKAQETLERPNGDISGIFVSHISSKS